jgi:hypothetical protein
MVSDPRLAVKDEILSFLEGESDFFVLALPFG